jgi:3-deoxy-manno-octulosonate cytidylyltransferase (CMP-KDO synthetase)
MARVIAIIPARLNSKRFTRKILFPIKGKPLIYHVWQSVRQSKLIDRLFIATDSEEIGQAVNDFGGAVIMTSNRPKNGTERVAEAVSDMRFDITVNVQGDNIGLAGRDLDMVIKKMTADPKMRYATLAQGIEGRGWKDKLYSPNVVKVVTDAKDDALWFSRYPIPFIKNADSRPAIKQFPYREHIGVYFIRKKALLDYASWKQGAAEQAESLEQLRILENGEKIRVYPCSTEVLSVDNEQEAKKIGRYI